MHTYIHTGSITDNVNLMLFLVVIHRHFDLNNIWLQDYQFASDISILITQTMQVWRCSSVPFFLLTLSPFFVFSWDPFLLEFCSSLLFSFFRVYYFLRLSYQPQFRYLAVQALLSHLDGKLVEERKLKRAILEVLSKCVAIAADGSIGEWKRV